MSSVALGDIVEIRKGKKPKVVLERPMNDSKPCILIDEVRGTKPSSFTTDEKGVEVIPDDLCIVWDGANAGTVGFGVNGFLGSTVARLRFKNSNSWHPSFVGRLLQGKFAALNDAAKGKGATIPHVDKRHLEELSIPLYPLDEQKRIAAILDQAAALRRLRQRAIDRVNTLGQAIFHEMFGDPVENSKGWSVSAISDLFTLKHGFAFKSENFVSEGKYVLLTPGNFYEQGGFRHRGEKQKYHNPPVSEDYVLSKGDILIAMTEQAPGLLGSPIIVPEDSKFLHNQRLGKVEKVSEVETDFIFEVMNASSIRARIQKDSTGLKVKHTSPTKIGAIAIGVPPLDLQKRYAAIAERIRQQKHYLSSSLSRANILFDSLQHRAFHGEL